MSIENDPRPTAGEYGDGFAPSSTADMVLSGHELLNHSLPQVKRGGLDPEAVQALLTRAATTIDTLYDQSWRATEEYNRLLAQLEQERSVPAPPPVPAPVPVAPDLAPVNESSRILAAADRTASEVIAQANSEAELLRARAAQERARGEAEVNDMRRQAQEFLRKAQADAAQRRAELADEVRDTEEEAARRIAEIQQVLAEANELCDRRRAEVDRETEELNASADRVRTELQAQLEAFRSHARAEREAAVTLLVSLTEELLAFDPAAAVPDEAVAATEEDVHRWADSLPATPATAPARTGRLGAGPGRGGSTGEATVGLRRFLAVPPWPEQLDAGRTRVLHSGRNRGPGAPQQRRNRTP